MSLIFSEKLICFWPAERQIVKSLFWPETQNGHNSTQIGRSAEKTIHYFILINYKLVLFEKDYYSWIVMMIMVWSDIFTILKNRKRKKS